MRLLIVGTGRSAARRRPGRRLQPAAARGGLVPRRRACRAAGRALRRRGARPRPPPGGDGMRWLRQWRGARARHAGAHPHRARRQRPRAGWMPAPTTTRQAHHHRRTRRGCARYRPAQSGRAQSVWEHGALQHDPAGRSVRWNDQPVELTARELMLLEALMAHPGRILQPRSCRRSSTTGANR